MDETVESIDVLLRLVDEAWKVRALSAEHDLMLLQLRLEETFQAWVKAQDKNRELLVRVQQLEEEILKERRSGHFRPDDYEFKWDEKERDYKWAMDPYKQGLVSGEMILKKNIGGMNGSTT